MVLRTRHALQGPSTSFNEIALHSQGELEDHTYVEAWRHAAADTTQHVVKL